MCKDEYAKLKRELKKAAYRLDDFRPLADDRAFHALLDATEQLFESAITHLDNKSKRPNACVCVPGLQGKWPIIAVGHPGLEAARKHCLTLRQDLWLQSSAAVDCVERAYCFLNAAINVLVELELRDRVAIAKKEPTPSTEKVGDQTSS